VNPPSAGGPGTVTEAVSIVSNAFPERQILNDAVDLTNADRILAAGGNFVRGDPSAAVQIANSTVNYTGANALVEVDRAGTTANLAGSLASIVDSTITGTGALFTLSNGAQLTSGPGTRTEAGPIAPVRLSESILSGANLAVASAFPLIEIDRSTVISASGIASILNGARLALDGSFIAITDAVLGAPSEQFSMVSLLNGASLVTTNPDHPVFDFVGSGPEQRSRVTSAQNFLALGNTAQAFPTPASMTLAGGLLTASRVDFTAGDPTTNVFSFIFGGDGAKLAGTRPQTPLAFCECGGGTAG